MDRSVLLIIVIAFGVLLLTLMFVGWRTRARRQRDVAAPQDVPAEVGEVLGVFEGRYVATCTSGDPYDRITVRGLAFRGDACVLVATGGVQVDRAGADSFWIPVGDLTDVRRATWTIDRVVEPDGLHALQWRLGDRVVETYFLMKSPTDFGAALAQLGLVEGAAS